MDWYTQLDEQVSGCLPELNMTADEPLSRHTSFRIGGPARRMAFPAGEEQLARLMELAEACAARTVVIGNGTNLLFPDEGLDALVITTSAMNGLELLEGGRIRAEAGVSLARLADFACRNALAGLEFAHGIPRSLGGAVCMNAGAYDGEMKQVLESVTAWFPGEGIRTLAAEELELSYRRSLFTRRSDGVVLSAVVSLQPGDPEIIRERMRELMQRRRNTQPLEFPSAGSTFKRPVGHFAGGLIQQCGLKGLTVGGAQVSEKHAGFIINIGGATFADVTELIRQVQRRVEAETGVLLEPEVKIIR